MDITVRIVVEENIVNAINHLADAIIETKPNAIQNKRKPALLNTAFDEAFKEKKTEESSASVTVSEPDTQTNIVSFSESRENISVSEALHTIDDVRAIAVKVSKKKGNEAVRKVLNSFGFGKVSDITEDRLDEIYKLLEEGL